MVDPENRRVVNVSTLANTVARELLLMVLQGEPPSGAALPSEAQLAGTFGVSRQVIREALKHMLTLGVVEARQGRPTRVAPYENWNQFAPELLEARKDIGKVSDIILELLELRRIVEREAAALAAERRTEDQLSCMRTAFAKMAACLDEPVAFSSEDVEFHSAMIAATANHLLVLLFKQLRPMLVLARKWSAVSDRNAREQALKEHKDILAAIELRSPELARSRMTDHLKWTVLPELARSILSDLAM